ncbi:MAG: hypothetical protein AAF705_02150 [Bacteroidota bacterium]
MNRTITIPELKQIFAFLEQKRVRHYDMQIELADHLATSIEERWETNQALSVKEALEMEYNKFGIYGFSKLMEQRKRSVGKRLFVQLNWQILAWLSFPKILPLIAFIMVWAQLLQEITPIFLLGGLAAVGCIFLTYGMIKNRIFAKRLQKKMLFLDAQSNLFIIGVNVFYLPIHLINIFQYEVLQMSFGAAHLFALISAYFILFCYELTFIHSKQKREEAEQLLSINQLTLNA